ncbi:hypothetical protein IscW_ISCW004742, partial [Ixodes scapularis]
NGAAQCTLRRGLRKSAEAPGNSRPRERNSIRASGSRSAVVPRTRVPIRIVAAYSITRRRILAIYITKKEVDVECFSMVMEYNKFMGGVDLLDSLIALHRISLCTKKYYLRLFFQYVDLATLKAWLLYRRNS